MSEVSEAEEKEAGAPEQPAGEGFQELDASGAASPGPGEGTGTKGEAFHPMSLGPLIDVPLRITVELGSTRMLVREVLQLNRGSVVALDRVAGDPAEVFVNGRLIARGEVTSVDDKLAIRIVELVAREGGEIPNS